MGLLRTISALVSLAGAPLSSEGAPPEVRKPNYRDDQAFLRGLFWRSQNTVVAHSKRIRDEKLVLRCPRNARGERLLGPDGRRLPAVLVPR